MITDEDDEKSLIELQSKRNKIAPQISAKSIRGFAGFVRQYSRKSSGDISYGTIGCGSKAMVVPTGKPQREFLEAFFNDTRKGELNVLAEYPSKPYFQWFLDADLLFCSSKFNEESVTKFAIRFSQILSKVVVKFFPKSWEKDTEIPCLKSEFSKDELNDKLYKNAMNEWRGAGDGIGRYGILILTSKMKNVEVEGQKCFKFGIHAHSIGRLRVTYDQAIIIRLAIMKEIEEEIPDWCEFTGVFTKTLEEAIDEKPYKTGLRMMLSAREESVCPDCTTDLVQLKMFEEMLALNQYRDFGKRQRKDVCGTCKGSGYILSNSGYYPFACFILGKKHSPLTKYFLDHPKNAFFASNFRTNYTSNGKSDFEIPEIYKNLKPIIAGEETEDEMNQRSKLSQISVVIHKIKNKGDYCRNKNDMLPLINYIKNWEYHGKKPYQYILPDKLTKLKNDCFVLTLLKPSNSLNPATLSATTCLRCTKSEHSFYRHENTTKFMITPERIIQQSWSSNTNCRELDKTVEFEKCSIPMKSEIATLLFPESAMKYFMNPKNQSKKSRFFSKPKLDIVPSLSRSSSFGCNPSTPNSQSQQSQPQQQQTMEMMVQKTMEQDQTSHREVLIDENSNQLNFQFNFQYPDLSQKSDSESQSLSKSESQGTQSAQLSQHISQIPVIGVKLHDGSIFNPNFIHQDLKSEYSDYSRQTLDSLGDELMILLYQSKNPEYKKLATAMNLNVAKKGKLLDESKKRIEVLNPKKKKRKFPTEEEDEDQEPESIVSDS